MIAPELYADIADLADFADNQIIIFFFPRNPYNP